jgi:hypothetical protein
MELTPLFGCARGSMRITGDIVDALNVEWTVLQPCTPRERDARDLSTLNRHAAELNAEAADAMSLQTLPED